MKAKLDWIIYLLFSKTFSVYFA